MVSEKNVRNIEVVKRRVKGLQTDLKKVDFWLTKSIIESELAKEVEELKYLQSIEDEE